MGVNFCLLSNPHQVADGLPLSATLPIVSFLLYPPPSLSIFGTLKEWSDRGNALESLTTRRREEAERQDEERGRLEKLVQAAEGEAGARGEEVARMMLDFETRAACAEAEMEQKVRENVDYTA